MALPSPLKAEVHEITGEVLESEALRVEGLRQLRAAFAAQKKAPKLVRDDDAFLLAFLCVECAGRDCAWRCCALDAMLLSTRPDAPCVCGVNPVPTTTPPPGVRESTKFRVRSKC